jgi:hypothetical protein
MAKQAKQSLQATDAFPITPSDSGDITGDAGNVNDYPIVYVHCTGTAGLVYVTPADAPDLTTTYDVPIYLALGQVSPLVVKKVWSTNTTATGLVALVGRGGSF